MRLRLLILPLAAALIYGLCEYKLSLPPAPQKTDINLSGMWRLAPSFEAIDVDGKVFRLQRYIGRQAVLLVFFDAKVGAANDSQIQLLVARQDQLARKGYVVVAVSNALPQQNRSVKLPSSFKLITDLDPLWAAHRTWNCFDEDAEKPIQAAFCIDRAGNTFATTGGTPVAIEKLEEWLAR